MTTPACWQFAIAQTTAIIAGFISYPFDTVRRRLQMQAEKPKEQWLYNGTLDSASNLAEFVQLVSSWALVVWNSSVCQFLFVSF